MEATAVVTRAGGRNYEAEVLDARRRARRLAKIRRRRIRFIKETAWVITRLLIGGISMIGALMCFLMSFILFYNAGYMEAALFLLSSTASIFVMYACLESVDAESRRDQKRAERRA
jgi:hypothetical protein